MSGHQRRAASSRPTRGLRGVCVVPGDKSISHRALMLAGLSVGRSQLSGLSAGDDVLRSRHAMEALGVSITPSEDGSALVVHGVGIGGLREPEDVIDMGNSGTGARLLAGMLATHRLHAVITGDASLRSRPMARITEPLSQFGASFRSRNGGLMPLSVRGSAQPTPIEYQLPVASAQVKSAVLLAGLNAPGTTSVVEQVATRAHTETMLGLFGVPVSTEEMAGGGRRISLRGHSDLAPCDLQVPADPSAAAFPIVGALITKDSELTIPGVMVGGFRAAFLDVLIAMGADITTHNTRAQAGEEVADITVRSSELRGTDIPAQAAARLIDEYPILAIAAACARGTTTMRGLGELRVKESDRLAAITDGLQRIGVAARAGEDWLQIEGCSASGLPGGGEVETHFDHRIAMSFLVAGCAAQNPIAVDDITAAHTSFVGFAEVMNDAGADIARTTDCRRPI